MQTGGYIFIAIPLFETERHDKTEDKHMHTQVSKMWFSSVFVALSFVVWDYWIPPWKSG